MEYLQTLCFAGFNSNMREFKQEIREKQQIAAVCCDRVLCVMQNVQAKDEGTMSQQYFVSQLKNIYIDRRAMSRQATENRKKPTETKISYVGKNAYRNRNPFCHDTDYCNIEQFVKTEEELKKKFLLRQENLCRNMRCLLVELTWLQQKNLMLRKYFKLRRQTSIATRKCMSRHRNKLNIEK